MIHSKLVVKRVEIPPHKEFVYICETCGNTPHKEYVYIFKNTKKELITHKVRMHNLIVKSVETPS